MYKPLRGPERLFRVGQWIVAVLFAYFLIQVGANLIADLPSVYSEPKFEDFLDKPAADQLEQSMQPVVASLKRLQTEREATRTQLETLEYDYAKDKSSFDNWRAARSSTEQSEQNPEVVAKARLLDSQLKSQQQLKSKLTALNQERQALEASIAPQHRALAELRNEARVRYDEALYWASLKDFGLRLLLVGPLLGLAIGLFRRYRTTQNWPFVWGFILFALFAFFFELVPYLPSFGGYVRYGVGALLTFLGGRSLIRALQHYLERKRQEQEAPQEERKQEIRYEKALDSLSRGQCPSCERTLLAVDNTEVNFCMHCGLKIYGTCRVCGLRHNAFFPFCPACGTASDTSQGASDASALPTKAAPPQG